MSTASPQRMRQFTIILGGQALSLIGSALVKFALIWYLTEQTGSAIVLTIATLASFIPPMLLSPIAGALVDRWDRRTVMIVADGFVAAATLAMAALFALGVDAIWQIYILMFLRASAGTFHGLATQSSTAMMVPKDQLARISGLFQMIQGISGVVGPPLGALLITVLPLEGVLAVDVFTAGFAIFPLLFIHIPNPERDTTNDEAFKLNPIKGIVQDIGNGVEMLRGWPAMLGMMVIIMFVNLFAGPTGTLLPILVTEHFQGDAAQFALLGSLWGAGFIAGSLILSAWGGFKNKMVTVMAGLAMFGSMMIVLGFMPPNLFIGGAIVIALGALSLPMINGSAMAVMQATVPPSSQARIFSLLGSISMLATPIGFAISGLIAEVLNVTVWYVIEGVGIILLALVGFSSRRVMNLEHGDIPEEFTPTTVEAVQG